MTTYALLTQICPACGNIVEYQSLTSTNSFGSPDLDLRPPPMHRNTIHTWVVRCHQCECCFEPDSESNDLDFDVMDTDEYKQLSKDQTLPELAKDFMCLGMLKRYLDGKIDALLHAAWVCDDEELVLQANTCRKKAYEILAKNYETGLYQHCADYIGNPKKGLIALDLLRRSQNFELAQQKIDKVKVAIGKSTDPDKKVMQAVLRFQAEKIGKRDERTFTIKDAVESVSKNTKQMDSKKINIHKIKRFTKDARFWIKRYISRHRSCL